MSLYDKLQHLALVYTGLFFGLVLGLSITFGIYYPLRERFGQWLEARRAAKTISAEWRLANLRIGD